MCSACRSRIRYLDSSRTVSVSVQGDGAGATCARTVPIVARFVFAEPVRHAIHLIKYRGERARSEWFAAELRALIEPWADDNALVVPVPLTKRRERNRGFNQSAEIALRLSKLAGVACNPAALRRVRETQPQVELTGLERIHNVRGAFEAAEPLDGRTVILIDDVATTGSTLRECAAACYAAGALSIVGIAAASGWTDIRPAASSPA